MVADSGCPLGGSVGQGVSSVIRSRPSSERLKKGSNQIADAGHCRDECIPKASPSIELLIGWAVVAGPGHGLDYRGLV